jgi:alkanesulfonate monooxygenase SsuD/methylene tetrahydromethanopterin reductase-like flavin-dependent oxidoreductase (luciferase family)
LWRAVEPNSKPARPGGIPIRIAGHSRRAARRGDGFIPGASSPEDFAAVDPVLQAEYVVAGWAPSTVEPNAAQPRSSATPVKAEGARS